MRMDGKLVLALLLWLLCSVDSAAQISFQTEVVRDLDSDAGPSDIPCCERGCASSCKRVQDNAASW